MTSCTKRLFYFSDEETLIQDNLSLLKPKKLAKLSDALTCPRNSAILLDDIDFHCKNTLIIVKKLLNYQCSHKSQTLYVLSHEFRGSSANRLLSSFDQLFITNTYCNFQLSIKVLQCLKITAPSDLKSYFSAAGADQLLVVRPISNAVYFLKWDSTWQTDSLKIFDQVLNSRAKCFCKFILNCNLKELNTKTLIFDKTHIHLCDLSLQLQRQSVRRKISKNSNHRLAKTLKIITCSLP